MLKRMLLEFNPRSQSRMRSLACSPIVKGTRALAYLRAWIAIVIFFTSAPLSAQTTYPVQVNPHLLPPYSLYLSDYYSGTREKLTVTLINRDQLKPLLNVKLKIVITAQGGVRLETNPNAYINPIQLENGAPVRLTLDDLAPYFQPENLMTQGYLTGGKLPEGYVQFCFQAFEAFTNQPLSLSSCAQAWITSQKPPLLSLPANSESVVFRDPLNIMFQWTPRHQGLTYVEYEFILKELWDNGMTPQAAFQYSPEIYRETVRSTSLAYGAFQPPLLPGKRYAWAVRAQAREGVEEVNVFQNDGYSEVRTFMLQDNCAPPEFVMATAERKRINMEWSPFPEHIGFTISYREVLPGATSEWTNLETREPKAVVYGLKNGATYEYRVASYCMSGQPVYSPIFSLTLPQEDSARLAQCGIMPEINLTNREPLKELKPGDVFKANDYPVTVARASGGNGVFTGEGWTIIPWLNDAKVAVQFTSITVNTDKQMIAGYVDAKYDKNEGQIANLDDVWEGGFDVGTVKTGITKIDHKFDFTIPGVDAFSLNDEGDLVITDSEGTPHVINQQYLENTGNEGNKVVVFPMTVADKDGKVYQVEKIEEKDAYGNVVSSRVVATEIGSVGQPLAPGSFDPGQLDGTKAIVTFTKGDGYFAFDEWKEYYGHVSLIKDKYEKLFTNYYAPWKLLVAGKTDVVYATIVVKDNSIDPGKVLFKTPQGTEFKVLAFDETAKTYKLQLAGGPAGDVQEIYALHPREDGKYWNLGKLSVATYEPRTFKVVLVSVNGAPADAGVEEKLKEIYGPIGVTWEVKREQFAYEGNIRLMENSTGLSTYNEAMRDLNDRYKGDAKSFDRSANYLFFLKATGAEQINDRDLAGFMPRGSQFGYIFTSEIKDANEAVTVAHELGHGRWKLYHTFDKHYGEVPGSRGTDNVMDYNNGAAFAKWQWDQINDPALMVNIFEGDERSKSATVVNLEGLKDFANKDQSGKILSYTFLARSGKPITVPATLTSVTFSTGDQAACEGNKFRVSPFGTVSKFKLKGDDGKEKEYAAYWSCSNNQFDSYRDNAEQPYYDLLTNVSITKAIVGFPAVSGGKLIYKVAQVEIEPQAGSSKYTGAGSYQAYDFLATKAKDITKFNEVFASFSPDYDPDVRQFIIKNYWTHGFDGANFYNNDIYVFTHATQLQKYNVLKGCFRTGVPGEMLKFITKHYEHYYTTSYGAPIVSSAELMAFAASHEENANALNAKSLIHHWEKYDLNYYPAISKAVNQFSIPEHATAGEIYELLQPISQHINSDNWNCFWDKITVAQRVELIDQLIPQNDAGDDTEEMILMLVTTLHGKENQVEFLRLLESDKYALFNKIWDILDQKERLKLSYELSSWLRIYRWPGDEYAEDEIQNLLFNTIKFSNTEGTNDNAFLLFNHNWLDDSGMRFEANLIASDKIRITHDFDPNNNGLPDYFEWQGAPFDWVVLRVMDDFPSYGLKEGEQLVVPALFVLGLDKDIDRNQNLAALRVLADVAAIALAPVTAGGSTAILLIEVSAATIDIAITVNRTELDNYLGPEAAVVWDVLYGGWNLFTLGRGFFVPTMTTVGGIERISSVKVMIQRADEIASNVARHGNEAEKLAYLKRVDELLNVLRTPKFENVAHAQELFHAALDLRLKVERSLAITKPVVDIAVKDGHLVVNKLMSVGKIDYIASVPTLTQNIRWLPATVTSVKLVDQYVNIAVRVNGKTITGQIDVVEDVANPGQFYLRSAQVPPHISNGLFSKYQKIESWINNIQSTTTRTSIETLIKDWPDNLLAELNSKLASHPGLGAEIVAKPKIANYFAGIHDNVWYKYGLLRDHYKHPTTSINLPANIRAIAEAMPISRYNAESIGVELAKSTDKIQTLGDLFEEALVREVGEAFSAGNFSQFPAKLASELKALYDQDYRIIVTQASVKTPSGPTPRPDMIFFKYDPITGIIDFDKVLVMDSKLNVARGYDAEDAQRALAIMQGTNEKGVIQTFNEAYSPTVYPGVQRLTTFVNEKITVDKFYKIGTALENEVYIITKKPYNPR